MDGTASFFATLELPSTKKSAPFTKSADTPWGAAINFDEEYSEEIICPVRDDSEVNYVIKEEG